MNAEISAFSSSDLNKYEFLKRIDLNYKPNALDKARFEFSPLGQTFNTGLDKKELINAYESELDKLNYEHNQKVKEISNELNNKGISINKLNTLNNEYKQIIKELENKLNNEKISLDEYKRNTKIKRRIKKK